MSDLHLLAVTRLEFAWNEVHDAKPDGWFVGTPVYIERRGWEQYAFDTRERHKHGAGRESGRRSPRPSWRSCARWRAV